MRKTLPLIAICGLLGCADEPQVTQVSDAFTGLALATAFFDGIDDQARFDNSNNVFDPNNSSNNISSSQNNTGQNNDNTPIDDSDVVGDLSPSQKQALCAEQQQLLESSGALEPLCRLAGVFAASLQGYSESACSQTVSQCTSAGGSCEINNTCPITVAQARECFSEAATIFSENADAIPMCAGLDEDTVMAIDLSAFEYTNPACQTLQDDC